MLKERKEGERRSSTENVPRDNLNVAAIQRSVLPSSGESDGQLAAQGAIASSTQRNSLTVTG